MTDESFALSAPGGVTYERLRNSRTELHNWLMYWGDYQGMHPDTGRRRWHYQFTPNDGHGWDSTEDMVLVDRPWQGRPRKLLLHADRNGPFYVLDRVTGEFLSGTPFIYQNWNKGFDTKGRPTPVPGVEFQC